MAEVNAVMKTAQKVTIETKVTCPNCGKPMVLRSSKTGSQFLGCSGYPDCKTAMSLNVMQEMEAEEGNETSEAPVQEFTGEKCDKCGADTVLKNGPYGKYTECVNADCKNRKPYRKSTGVTCPKCGKGTIVERKSKRGTVFYGCDKYPDCDYVLWNEPTGETCPTCGSLLVKKQLKKGTVISCSKMGCSYKIEPEQEEA
jgi:DNA topoisomerase-1